MWEESTHAATLFPTFVYTPTLTRHFPPLFPTPPHSLNTYFPHPPHSLYTSPHFPTLTSHFPTPFLTSPTLTMTPHSTPSSTHLSQHFPVLPHNYFIIYPILKSLTFLIYYQISLAITVSRPTLKTPCRFHKKI